MNTKSMKLLSIDPGTSHTGIAIMEVDYQDNIKVLYVNTINTDPLIREHKDICYMRGDRFCKTIQIVNQIRALIISYQPKLIVSESPYFNPKAPIAYSALIELLASIRMMIHNFDISLPFRTIDPSTVKNGLNVIGNSKDKDHMKIALRKQDITYVGDIDIEVLDEHSIDALAVGITMCKELALE